MATVTASKAASTVTYRQHEPGLVAVKSVYAVPATGDGTAAGDIIQMVKVPAGAVIHEILLSSEDLDSNGTPTITLDVGDGDDVDRFIDGTTIGQTGGLVRLGQGVAAAAIDGAHGYTYTADDTIDVKVVDAAATKVAGNLTLTVIYSTQA